MTTTCQMDEHRWATGTDVARCTVCGMPMSCYRCRVIGDYCGHLEDQAPQPHLAFQHCARCRCYGHHCGHEGIGGV